MNRAAPVLLALSVVAACTSNTTTSGARFGGPSAIVQFYGRTRNNAAADSAIQPYLAVADARASDLRLVDPSVDQPVLGPGIVESLSVATLPRPLRLAVASLGDGQADVLVSASAGEPVLQVVETWTYKNRIALEVDLRTAVTGVALPQDAEVLAMVGLTTVAADNTKLGRILVAVTGQHLFVVDFARGPDGFALVQRAVAHQALAFDAVDLAVGPPDPAGATVYAATRDALSQNGATVHGVVAIQATGDAAAPFPTTVYDALAPTVAVAAALVDERRVAPDSCAADSFGGVPQLRVYAALDPDACGPDHAIGCGVATLDPARTPVDATTGQLAADPATAAGAPDLASPYQIPPVPAQRFRPPMPVPGVPLHIAIGGVPVKNPDPANPARIPTTASLPSTTCPVPASAATSPLARVLYGGTIRYANAVAMVTSTDGNVYWLDLTRFGPVEDSTSLAGLGRTLVLSASSDSVGLDQWQLGLWYDVPGVANSGKVVVDAVTLPNAIETWPGFTPGANWSAVYQGALPGLSARPGVVVIAPGGSTAWVAPQSFVGSDPSSAVVLKDPKSWSAPVPVDDAARGVRSAADFPAQGGDIVTFNDLGCEEFVASLIPGSTTQPVVVGGVAFPHGALQLKSVPPCVAASGSLVVTPAGSWLATQISILASDVVVTSDLAGYLGRAPIATSSTPTDAPYELAWQDEATLAAATDRASQEKLAVVRQARRIFYPTDGPCPLPNPTTTDAAKSIGCYTSFPRLADPLAPGPAIRFRLGLRNTTNPAAVPAPPPRGLGLHFATQLGLARTSRRPVLGGAPPATLVAVDPGDLVNHVNPGDFNHVNDDFHFYVAYQDDQVAWFTTTSTISQVTSYR